MAAKTIAIWGRNGCGKTTLAFNLAGWLAQNQMLVGLISAADFAEIPSFLGLTFPTNKGLKAAKDFPTEHIKEFYIGTMRDSSMYLLSPPPDGDSFDMCGFDKAFGRRIIQESKETFDVVIVDCTSYKENAITGEAIALSDAVIVPVDDNIAYPEWYHSNIRIFENIKVKTVFVESKYNGYTNMQSLLKSMGVNSTSSLQYIRTAPGDTNEGKFIFKGGREQKIYERALNTIWEAVTRGK